MNPFLNRRLFLTLTGAAALIPGRARAQAANATDEAFDQIAEGWLEESIRLSPPYATSLGDHRFDDQLGDLGPASWRARSDLARRALEQFASIDRAALSREHQVDAALLDNSLRGDIWTHDVLQAWARDPLVHNEYAGSALYSLIAREFAPLPERLRAATVRLQGFPALLASTRDALDPSRVPAIHAQTVSGQNRGLASLVDMILAEGRALGPTERAALNDAGRIAKLGIEAHQQWIDEVLVPGAQGDFRLGPDLYDAKLAFALNSPLSRAEIKAQGEAEMARVRNEMYQIARDVLAGREGAPATPRRPTDAQRQTVLDAAMELVYADRPSRDGLVQAAEAMLVSATDFVRERNLVTVPDEPVRIVLTPEFQRGVAVAYCDSPGPLDREQPTFYKISPIPDGWTDDQAQSFLREYNTRALEGVTVHEAMPGHYLQLAHANRYPSMVRAVLASGPFIEGWACYAQDVMVEAGHLEGDPLYRLANLKFLLRVIANALLDIGVHVDGMSRDEAMRMMTEDAFQQESEAAGKWIRAQLSSAQLPTYFVGWREHWALRREMQEPEGERFDLKAYHDQVLSYGSPPVRYARALMKGEPIN
ncbi:MAG: DUF885 domain-containing protein [Caulobacterales bacterium]|nr:DUF885 domain-containing protein [Caulobacterales bacterium]